MMLFVGRLYWRTCEVDRGDLFVGGIDDCGCFHCTGKVLKFVDSEESYREHFVNPSETDSDDSYQSDQAKIAVAKGGLVGLGQIACRETFCRTRIRILYLRLLLKSMDWVEPVS